MNQKYATQKGGHQMRRDDQPVKEDSEAVSFNFNFQITNGAGRKACSVRVQAHNYHDATDFFRQNWPTIESMARESLASAADGTEIKLTMPCRELAESVVGAPGLEPGTR
jgi:hypothetical protein